MTLTTTQAAVLATAREELDRLASDQQALADDLAELLGDTLSPALIRRLQGFDELRQRTALLGDVLEVLATTPPEGTAEAVLRRLTLEDLRRSFAGSLGIVSASSDSAEDIELF